MKRLLELETESDDDNVCTSTTRQRTTHDPADETTEQQERLGVGQVAAMPSVPALPANARQDHHRPPQDSAHPMHWIWQRRANRGRGDCLFESLADALGRYPADGVNFEPLRARLAMIGLDQSRVSAQDLRRVAYSLFLVPGAITDAILALWQSARRQVAGEYPQVECIGDKPIELLDELDRVILFQNCMCNTTWGDDSPLQLLERLLQFRCIVVCKEKVQIRDLHVSGFDPIVYVVVSLDEQAQHYEAMYWTGTDGIPRFAFADVELPDAAIRICHRDCRLMEDTYISLHHLELGTPLSPERAREERGSEDQSARPKTTSSPPDAAARAAAEVFDHYVKCQELLRAALTPEFKERLAVRKQQPPPQATIAADGAGKPRAGITEHLVYRLQCGLSLEEVDDDDEEVDDAHERDESNMTTASEHGKSRSIVPNAAVPSMWQ